MSRNYLRGNEIGAAPILGLMPGPWGKAIEQLAHVDGRSGEKIAKKAKVSANTYGTALAGGDVRTSSLRKIAEAFGVPIEQVLVPHHGEQRPTVIVMSGDQFEEVARAINQSKPPTPAESADHLERHFDEQEKQTETRRSKKADKKQPPIRHRRKVIRKDPKRRFGHE